jgi:hypothetical protein
MRARRSARSVAIGLCAIAACARHRAAATQAHASDAAPIALADATPGPRPHRYVKLDSVAVAPPEWADGLGPAPSIDEIGQGIEVELAPCVAIGGDDVPQGAVADRGKLEVEIGVESAPAEKGEPARVGVAVALRLTWIGDDEELPLSSKVLMQKPIGKAQVAAVAHDTLVETVREAVHGMCAKAAIRGGDDSLAIAALDEKDPELVIYALGVVGDRKLVAAYDKIVALLHAEDEEERDAAIGTLVALGDERGVHALSELAEFKDLDLMRRVIDAIGAIGGDEAHDYLQLVASGHDVPAIQALAKEALDRLERRQHEKAKQ